MSKALLTKIHIVSSSIPSRNQSAVSIAHSNLKTVYASCWPVTRLLIFEIWTMALRKWIYMSHSLRDCLVVPDLILSLYGSPTLAMRLWSDVIISIGQSLAGIFKDPQWKHVASIFWNVYCCQTRCPGEWDRDLIDDPWVNDASLLYMYQCKSVASNIISLGNIFESDKCSQWPNFRYGGKGHLEG